MIDSHPTRVPQWLALFCQNIPPTATSSFVDITSRCSSVSKVFEYASHHEGIIDTADPPEFGSKSSSHLHFSVYFTDHRSGFLSDLLLTSKPFKYLRRFVVLTVLFLSAAMFSTGTFVSVLCIMNPIAASHSGEFLPSFLNFVQDTHKVIEPNGWFCRIQHTI